MHAMHLKERDLIRISDLSREEIEHILLVAGSPLKPDLLRGSLIASCFFEPSTRTRLSFEAAVHRLGGAVIGFSDAASTSVRKGESLADTVRMIGSYADLVILRHFQAGAAEIGAMHTEKPLINAGDGNHEHPSQTLVDLFSIQACQGKIDGLEIVIGGDLAHARAIHSLCLGLAHFQVQLHFLGSGLPEPILQKLKQKKIPVAFHETGESAPWRQADILYLTRRQTERGPGNGGKSFVLKKELLQGVKPNFRVLHPLPRAGEIDENLDAMPYAYYFQQAANGVPVRMALLALLLGKLP